MIYETSNSKPNNPNYDNRSVLIPFKAMNFNQVNVPRPSDLIK